MEPWGVQSFDRIYFLDKNIAVFDFKIRGKVNDFVPHLFL
jgi:hypothetical protein